MARKRSDRQIDANEIGVVETPKRKAAPMTTAALQTLSGSSFGAVLSRIFVEFQVFFEESSLAIAHGGRDQPFGA